MKTNRLFSTVAVLALCFTSIVFQAQAQQPLSGSNNAENKASSDCKTRLTNLLSRARPGKRSGFALMPSGSYENTGSPAFSITPLAAGPSPIVTGSGTLGRLTKWSGFTSSNSVIGDTTIYEDKFGNVGIGTDSPTSKLTVSGVIESTGGFRFPDGTVKMSAGVIHDASLNGDGTTASLLGVAVPLVLKSLGGPLGVIQATNTTSGGFGIRAVGGNGDVGIAGVGVVGIGGASVVSQGGAGAAFAGGLGDNNIGGEGVQAFGGNTVFGS
ncbi:MAG TPA: hypothetical protein VGV87_23515, partial [Blastocatellia bacterium]|nr:hypothetical protein [Blastocatellia bacterium]